MKKFVTGAIVAIAAMGAHGAQAAAPSKPIATCGSVDIPGFVPAKIDHRPLPRYPLNQFMVRDDGWMLIEYTVAADGSVRDIIVRDALGPSEFVAATMRLIPAWKFRPATRNGVAVEESRKLSEVTYRYYSGSLADTSSHESVLIYVHHITDLPLAATHSEDFETPFDRAAEKFDGKNYAEAIERLEKMQASVPMDLFERSRVSYLLARAYSEIGDHARAYGAIVHATIRNAVNLEPKRRGDALLLRMKLAIQVGALAEAACAFEVLSSVDPAAAAPGSLAAKLLAALSAVTSSPAPVQIPAKLAAIPYLGEPAGWRHRLLRSKFSFARVQGDVKTFRLACTGTILEAAVDQEQQWSVPKTAGTCDLHVRGAPNAAFTLVEE